MAGQLGSKPLYEFIYIDDYRLKSLIAQINNEGILLEYQKNASISSTTNDTEKSSVGGGVGISKTELKGSKETTESNTTTDVDGENLKYDATFASPIQLFDTVLEHDLAYKSLQKAPYGGLIHLTGQLQLIDTSNFKVIQNLFDPFMKLIGSTHNQNNELETFGVNTNGLDELPSAEIAIMKTLFSMVESFPSTINMKFNNRTGNAWSTLNRDFLKIDMWDYLLKIGSVLPGEWHCLALLDSDPVHNAQAGSGSNDQRVDAILAKFLGEIRPHLGIESATFGITPVLIFREVVSAFKR